MALQAKTLAAFHEMQGQELGVSSCVPVTQSRIDEFAACTLDKQFIHVDIARAATTPFGGTIAHGFLTLSLLSAMAFEAVPSILGAKMTVNYGFQTLRFIAPVRAGKRIRGRFYLSNISERRPTEWKSTYQVTVEIEGETRPALTGEWLHLTMM